MSIRLIAALALCARVGSDELDPCSGVRNTYVDPFTNVLHDCWFICDSVIRDYKEHCKAYCPEYYQCNENFPRATTITTVQTTVLSRSTYPATASYDVALNTISVGQHVTFIVTIAVITLAVLCCVAVIACTIVKWIGRWKWKEWVDDKLYLHQRLAKRSGLSTQEPETDTQKINLSHQPATNEAIVQTILVEAVTDGDDNSCSPKRTPSPESGIYSEPSNRDSSNEGSEVEQYGMNGMPNAYICRDEHQTGPGGCGEALTSPSSLQDQESHRADQYGSSDGQPTQPARSEQHPIVSNHDGFLHRDSESEPPNNENYPLLPSPQCNIDENIRQLEPDDAYTSLPETESAYHSTPYPGSLRTNPVRVDDPLRNRDYGSHYPSTLTGSSYAIMDVEQGNGERRAFLASTQSLYHSQQPSMNPQIDQETRPKTQMTTEA